MQTFRLIWSPTDQQIATGVIAKTARAAIRKAPAPYRKFLGEIYAEECMREDVQFFYDHAGFSVASDETREEGKKRCAKSLAAAEATFMQAAKVADVGITWEHDDDDTSDGDSTPEKREQAYIWHRNESGKVEYLASLGSIHDADANYRRVIRAELASECLDLLTQITAKG